MVHFGLVVGGPVLALPRALPSVRMDGTMTSPLRSEDLLIEGLSQMLTVERRSMPVAARLHLTTHGEHVLYLDPDASDDDREQALIGTLAALLLGPDAAVGARRARHLNAVT